MRALVISPSRPGNKSGNSVTARRWAAILRSLGWDTSLSTEYRGQPAEMMIALNAYRTAESAGRFHDRHPGRPLVVALTGTDLYRFLESHPEVTSGAMEAADRLIVLNTRADKALDPRHRRKCFTILESADPLPSPRRPLRRHFDVCVVGHLRAEKNPMLTAEAAHALPDSSRIRVRHYGRAHTPEWAEAAQAEMVRNPRYTWFGEVPHWRIRRALSTSRLMVVSSLIEGGPNCLSEAIIAGLPAITTDIDGCVGVLGPDHPGYFRTGDAAGLTRLLLRAETDASYLADLEASVAAIAPMFTRDAERDRWATLLSELGHRTTTSEATGDIPTKQKETR